MTDGTNLGAGTTAEQSPPAAQPASSAPNTPGAHGRRASARKVERSCIMCHRRKVRCDKKLPCSTCSRGGVLCCYPPGDRPVPRQPKSTIADIASRLVQLERTLVALSSDALHPTAVPGSPTRHPSVREPAPDSGTKPSADDVPSSEASTVDEMLVEHGPSSRYINEVLLSRVLEEEQEIQSVMATPRYTEPGGSSREVNTSEPFSIGTMLPGSITNGSDVRKLYPSTYHAMQLWHVFVNHVDPVSKVLHIPTVQVEVFTAINSQYDTSPDMHCLLFTIFFSSVTALMPDDALHLLGHDKATVLGRFRQGLELSLARANILETPTMKAIQALGIFLKNYRAINNGRSVWILSGVALRAAQSIGLHRDGTNFGLPPFECEMRRRLYWYLNSLNDRAGEDHGLVISHLDQATDIQLPLNVDDRALDPSMEALPPSQQRWTEMTIAVSMYESGRAFRQLYRMMRGFRQRPSEDERRDIVEKLTARVDAMFSSCNPVVPIQRASLLMSRIIAWKVNFVSRQQWFSTTSSRVECTEDTLCNAVEILELNLQLGTDELLRNFAWIGEAYPQYHTMLYTLWHLNLHPTGPTVDRAWDAVNGAFFQEKSRQQRQGQLDSGPKWGLLAAMRDKALRAREIAEEGTPHGASRLELNPAGVQAVSESGSTFADDALVEGVRMNTMDWDGGYVDWNWLIEDFAGQHYTLQ